MAHPTNRVLTGRAAEYDYGPPVTQGDGPEDSGTPQDNSDAVTVDEPGESPMGPPPGAATITEPGGSPTDEVIAAHDPYISSLMPFTAVAGVDTSVTVTGERFSAESVVEADHVAVATTYVSDTELTATLNGSGTVTVTVRNTVSEQESNSVDFNFTEPEE